MARAQGMDLALAIIMIVLGVLVLLGNIGLGSLLPFLGIVLIIVGIMILAGAISGSTLTGIIMLILGLLLALNFLNLGSALRPVFEILDYIVGVVLIIFGVLKLMGK